MPVLWALVGFNLLLAAGMPWVLFAAMPRGPFSSFSIDLFSPHVIGSLVFLSAEVLLLGFWTALYDPKWPVRWLSLVGIIAIGAAVVFADVFLLMFVFLAEMRFWIEPRFMTSFFSASAFLVTAFILLLLTHSVLWLGRSLFGWRISLDGDPAEGARPQFGMAQGLLWIGLISAALGAGRAFSGQEWFLLSMVYGGVTAFLAAGIVFPTIWATFRQRSLWRLGVLMVNLTAVSAAAGTVGYQLMRVPGLFFLSWAFGIALAFVLTVAAVTWFNVWIWRQLGARLVVAKPRQRAIKDPPPPVVAAAR